MIVFYFHSIQDMDKRLQALMAACEKLPTDNLNNFRSVAFPNFPGSTSTEKDWKAMNVSLARQARWEAKKKLPKSWTVNSWVIYAD